MYISIGKTAGFLPIINFKRLCVKICLITSLLLSVNSFADTTLYHIVSEKELTTLTENNVYKPPLFDLEGYIHFSKLSLILPIANDAYKDRDVLFLLQVTFSDDDKNLRWIGDNPDYYVGLDLSMVENKIQFSRDDNNQWVLPKTFKIE
jgi:uncharacterized protein (DUF952 family)